MTGWDNPTVKFNGASLQIGTETQPVRGENFYNTYLSWLLSGTLVDPFIDMSYMYMVDMYDERSANATEHAPLHTLQINSTRTLSESSSPDVYGVVVVLDSAGPLIRDTYADQVDDAPGMTFLTDITRVNQEGQLDVHLPVGEVQFVESLSTQPEPGTAVLVRLTGGSNEFQRWYEVVSPEQIQEIN